jgi:hypothetical protein
MRFGALPQARDLPRPNHHRGTDKDHKQYEEDQEGGVSYQFGSPVDPLGFGGSDCKRPHDHRTDETSCARKVPPTSAFASLTVYDGRRACRLDARQS